MNTTKKLLVLCITLVLLTCCIVPSFSWYSHNGKNKETVNAISYTINTLPVSGYVNSSDLEMHTYKGSIDKYGEVSYKEEAMSAGDKITAAAGSNGEYTTTCYKSVIKNSSTKAVRVGLYLETAEFGEGDDSVCFGTSDPIWRRITSGSMNTVAAPKTTKTNTMRIYFQPSNVWSEKKLYVVTNNGNEPIKENWILMTNSGTDYAGRGVVYYADIPGDTKALYFACNTNPALVQKTNTLEDVQGEDGMSQEHALLLYLQTGLMKDGMMQANPKDNGTNYAKRVPDGYTTNIFNYVTDLYLSTIGTPSKGSVTLTKNTDWVGESISYTSDNPSIASVDSNGKVTGKAPGSTTITTKVTGKLGDIYSVETTVIVQDPDATVPLVQNVLVPAKKDNVPGQASVCWYIDNKTANELEDIKLMLTL